MLFRSDVFFEGAFNYVAFIFSSKKEVNWLQGYPTVINEDDKIIYKRDPICNPSFFYLGLHEITNSYIQQESTFWSRKLWNNAGARINTNYSLAGDFDLWMKFFQSEKLFCSRKKLASFRKRPGQKSSNIQKYILETRQSLSQNIKKMKWLDRLFLKSIQLLLSEKKIPNTIKNILIKKAVPFVNFID